MKRNIPRALVAALSLGCASLAQAVPLYFDFTGTITSTSTPAIEGAAVGTAISGGFNLETNRFERSPYPQLPIIQFLDWQPVNLGEPLAFVNFAGRELTVPSYNYSNYTSIEFYDNCPSAGPCIPGTSEGFSIFSSTSDGDQEADFTGTLHSSYIQIYATRFARFPGDSGIVALDYFDGAVVDPFAVVSLPLYILSGFVGEDTQTCVLGECTYEGRQSSFSLDTVTRGAGSRSVPELGTLGLLGFGLAGMFAARRRKALRQQRINVA
jgi:hypothetical protein